MTSMTERLALAKVNRRTRRMIRKFRSLLKTSRDLQMSPNPLPVPKEVFFRAEELLIQIIPLFEESMKIESVAARGAFILAKIDPLMDEYKELTKPYVMDMSNPESVSNAN